MTQTQDSISGSLVTKMASNLHDSTTIVTTAQNQEQVSAEKLSVATTMKEMDSTMQKYNTAIVDRIMTNKCTSEVVEKLTGLLNTSKLNVDLENVIKNQNAQSFTPNESTTFKSVMDTLADTPRDVLYPIIAGLIVVLGILVYHGLGFIVLLTVVGLCFVASRGFGHLETQTKVGTIAAVQHQQLALIKNDSDLSQIVALELANRAKEIQDNQSSTLVKAMETQATTYKQKLATLEQMTTITTQGNIKIQEICELGQTKRTEINTQMEHEVAKIQAHTAVTKAELEKQTKIETGNLQLQGVALEQQTKRDDSQNQRKTAEAVARIQEQTQGRVVQHEKDMTAQKLNHEKAMQESKLRSDAEIHRRQTHANKEAENVRAQVAMNAEREATMRHEYSTRPKPKSGCILM